MSKQGFTPGPWMIATSNSWRRVVSQDHGTVNVCEPIVQNDGHPDLYFKNGGEDGPDARLIASAPDLYESVSDLLKMVEAAHRELGIWTKDNPRIAKARAALSKLTGGGG